MTNSINPGPTTRNQRARQRGWQPWDTRAFWCPRSLVRKRCRGIDERSGCAFAGVLRDHPQAWRTRDGIRFMLWEPYDFGPQHQRELARVTREAAALGVEVRVDSRFENHYPGRCTAIVFCRTEDAPALFA